METVGQIPVIDVSPALSGTDAERVARQLGDAIRDTGFLQIVGHGIDIGIFDRLHDAGDELWAWTPEQLDDYASPIGHPFRGVTYTLDDGGHFRQQGVQNIRYFTPEDAIADGVPATYADFYRGNAFPPLPELTDAYTACFAATRALGRQIIRLLALELGLRADGLDEAFEHDASYLAVFNYPSIPGSTGGDIRNGEHTDSGALAMLHQRGNYDGLNVRLRSGERVPMPVINDALVVNVGDLVARWTNDTWLATPHWVSGGGEHKSRRTIVTHYLPGPHAVIEPLPSCVTEGSPRYEPVRMQDWNDMYFEKRNRVLRLETAAG